MDMLDASSWLIMLHFGQYPWSPIPVQKVNINPLILEVYVKVTWRRGRDSNPRNLAVHLISNPMNIQKNIVLNMHGHDLDTIDTHMDTHRYLHA